MSSRTLRSIGLADPWPKNWQMRSSTSFCRSAIPALPHHEMLARHKAILDLSLLFLFLLSVYPAFFLARDCYAPSLFPRFYIALAGGVIVATLFAILDFPTSDTSSRRKHPVNPS